MGVGTGNLDGVSGAGMGVGTGNLDGVSGAGTGVGTGGAGTGVGTGGADTNVGTDNLDGVSGTGDAGTGRRGRNPKQQNLPLVRVRGPLRARFLTRGRF